MDLLRGILIPLGGNVISDIGGEFSQIQTPWT